ncbi:protein-export chaperone SecB [Erwinia aphidicola]|nr:protein-export chaperone SecB [Erwinia aphidicola]
MEFDLIDMEVKSLHLQKESQDSDKKPVYQLKIDSAMDYNQADMMTVRLNVTTLMTADNEFRLDIEHIFYFKFKRQVTGEEAQHAVVTAKTESIVFPYIRSYITNLLAMSGYPAANIPFILVAK